MPEHHPDDHEDNSKEMTYWEVVEYNSLLYMKFILTRGYGTKNIWKVIKEKHVRGGKIKVKNNDNANLDTINDIV